MARPEIDREQQILDIVLEEMPVLSARRDREAFAAGLRAAARICDVVAEDVRDQNPGRGHGKTSKEGEFGAGIAEACGDKIMERAALFTTS